MRRRDPVRRFTGRNVIPCPADSFGGIVEGCLPAGAGHDALELVKQVGAAERLIECRGSYASPDIARLSAVHLFRTASSSTSTAPDHPISRADAINPARRCSLVSIEVARCSSASRRRTMDQRCMYRAAACGEIGRRFASMACHCSGASSPVARVRERKPDRAATPDRRQEFASGPKTYMEPPGSDVRSAGVAVKSTPERRVSEPGRKWPRRCGGDPPRTPEPGYPRKRPRLPSGVPMRGDALAVIPRRPRENGEKAGIHSGNPRWSLDAP